MKDPTESELKSLKRAKYWAVFCSLLLLFTALSWPILERSTEFEFLRSDRNALMVLFFIVAFFCYIALFLMKCSRCGKNLFLYYLVSGYINDESKKACPKCQMSLKEW